MTYFELFGIPVSFHPDQEIVKKKFYDLSRQYHPDKFAQAGSKEQADALHAVSIINGAYKTLCSSDDTMEYILKMNGIVHDDEKYNLPAAFLGEMMELNEAVSDYLTEPQNNSIFKKQLLGDIDEPMLQLTQAAGILTAKYDAGDHSKELLLQIKDFYFRKKYLLRLKSRVETMVASHY